MEEIREEQLSQYYRIYLQEVKGVSKSTVGHYFVALNTISKMLRENGIIKNNVFEIKEMEELLDIENTLYNTEDFLELNKKGNRMYSSGLKNYIQFASGVVLSDSKDIEKMDVPQKNVGEEIISEQKRWKRSGIVRSQVIEAARHQCELDPTHKTFLAAKDEMPYVESHHIIPIKNQDHFEYSLDVYANIICLCPICHRKIHYGLENGRKDMLNIIYGRRNDRLKRSGLSVSKDEMIRLCLI